MRKTRIQVTKDTSDDSYWAMIQISCLGLSWIRHPHMSKTRFSGATPEAARDRAKGAYAQYKKSLDFGSKIYNV